METLKRYKVVICPKCGEVQTSEAQEAFKCRNCHATRKMFSEKVIGTNIRVLASYDHPIDATEFVKEYKKRVAAKKDAGTGFATASDL